MTSESKNNNNKKTRTKEKKKTLPKIYQIYCVKANKRKNVILKSAILDFEANKLSQAQKKLTVILYWKMIHSP